jgi:hypothetical protein
VVSIWPRTRRVPTALRTTGIDDVEVLRVLDDQHVLTDGARTALRYAPATPGRCPVLTDSAPSADLGGWTVRSVHGWSLGDDSEQQSESWNIVCDPQTGRYIDIVGDESGGTPGDDSGTSSSTHLVRSGDWLASSQHGTGSIAGDQTLIADARTGRHYLAAGRADGPGLDHSTEYHATPPVTGAIIEPGAVAFIATNPDPSIRTQTLILSDTVGTRTLAVGIPATPLGALAGDGTTLRWTAGGVAHSTTIAPKIDAPYSILRPTAGF